MTKAAPKKSPAKKITKPVKEKKPAVVKPPDAKHAGGRPPKFTDVEELEQKIEDFFAYCEANEYPYTIHGLCVSLDCTRDTLCEYEKKPQFSDTIKKAKEKIRWFVERELFQGKNPSGMIFWLKNNAGWKDKQEIEHSGDGLQLSVSFGED